MTTESASISSLAQPRGVLLSTKQGISLLRESVQAAGSAAPVSLEGLDSFLVEDMAYVEHELGRTCARGEAPGTDAAQHLLASGGKRARPLTVLLAASCFGPITAPARELAVVAELLHAATLLHDDVIDDAPERRGRPTSKQVLGNAVSVLGGDLLLTHALDRALSAAPATLPGLLTLLRQIVDGEIIQLRGRTELSLNRGWSEPRGAGGPPLLWRGARLCVPARR
jgi:octaprenyl-diphosphate synthase